MFTNQNSHKTLASLIHKQYTILDKSILIFYRIIHIIYSSKMDSNEKIMSQNSLCACILFSINSGQLTANTEAKAGKVCFKPTKTFTHDIVLKMIPIA